MTQSKATARLLGVIVAAIAALAVMAPAAMAETEPAEGYEQFFGCPDKAENEETVTCLRSVVTGGHLNAGNKELPIEKPLEINGGTNAAFENFDFNSKGGFLPVAQKVPGGVIGLTGLTWLLELFGSEALTLYATTELAGNPTNFTFSSVTLPIKVHLTNPAGLLGSTCYLGSDANPIVLNLTTGTTEPPPPNEPITGKQPKLSADAKGIVHLDEGTFVDNSFAVPGVNGCKLVLFGFIPISINGLVNELAGLPAAAGTNESVQDYSIEFVGRGKVYP
ncbi:MAG TPA: hypothetical protein VFT19_04750 [Solirubrobacterales bacterium]|nr:hypothetical protein [Solirubrobacterales bacterium]